MPPLLGHYFNWKWKKTCKCHMTQVEIYVSPVCFWSRHWPHPTCYHVLQVTRCDANSAQRVAFFNIGSGIEKKSGSGLGRSNERNDWVLLGTLLLGIWGISGYLVVKWKWVPKTWYEDWQSFETGVELLFLNIQPFLDLPKISDNTRYFVYPIPEDFQNWIGSCWVSKKFR